MAISFVGYGTIGNGSDPTVGVPSGVQSGDLLIIAISSGGATSTPSGWTLAASQISSGPLTYVFYKTAGASESSVTLNNSSAGNATAVMVAYTNVSAYERAATPKWQGSVTSIATNTLTTTNANDYIISIYSGNSNTSYTVTAPASTTERVNQSGTASYTMLLLVDELQASTGTTTARTATVSTTRNLNAFAIAISPSATATGNFFGLF